MNQKGFAPIAIILIIIGSLALGGGVLYVKEKKKTKEIKKQAEELNQNQQTNQQPAPVQQDETVGWKIYRDEKYGFEVKYPVNWNYKEEIPKPQNFGLRVIFKKDDKDILTIHNPIPEIGYEAWELFNTKKIKIQDSERYLTKYFLKPLYEEFNNVILIKWNEENWEKSGQIGFNYKDSTDPNLKILDQILSTFKFIQ